MSSTVSGVVSLPAEAPAAVAARVLVEVRNVSLADAPSVVVGAQVQTDVPLRPGGRIPFSVDVPDLDPGDSYGLRVHVDLAGTGVLEPGDLISTQSNPVPAEPTDELVAPVSPV
ncbi:YbaY family lipoprotein [Streptomyces sp. NPDC050636]|uniref:YbaY family lipoprotein n=1 Tax=Streptomyces sp. NPDC050636 TaxID=3154510 RepID=UPI00341CB3D1